MDQLYIKSWSKNFYILVILLLNNMILLYFSTLLTIKLFDDIPVSNKKQTNLKPFIG